MSVAEQTADCRLPRITVAPPESGAARSLAEPLSRAFAGGIAWTAAARWGAQTLSWGATLLVARLLTPADYGLVAMATVFTGL